ncbi:TIM barrel protein [Rubrobacter marinus]|uniref:TIM barrel protein n=1 Tax=Rubrobacter marinus TaxID=2653852 RepID=A0A6G8Q134_9ACTN|nr:sugar phosphate isomerase/epimerase family protein [Rubrobacter marinus]QIN80120.1 TIM barrel protein [Rubrobacter marinus]
MWSCGRKASGDPRGALDPARLDRVLEPLLDAGLAYTVHAPLEIDLMDPTSRELQRDVLDASLRFARAVGADVVVCHAGQRVGARDAPHRLKDQLACERDALREAGEIAGEMGAVIAVENYYPELPILRGEVYDYSVWPSELAEQISAVDHPCVGLCLDVGHAALAARAFGFDYLEECAAVAPLVRHLHLHDNLRKPNLTGNPPVSEHTVYGLGDLHLPPGRGTIPSKRLSAAWISPTTLPAASSSPRTLVPGPGGSADRPRARTHGDDAPEKNPSLENGVRQGFSRQETASSDGAKTGPPARHHQCPTSKEAEGKIGPVAEELLSRPGRYRP